MMMTTKGITVDVAELIALQRFAQVVRYAPERRAARVGNHLSKLRGRGMDFAEARNYQPGDEVRHMEWRVTARTGRPHVKLYQEERERPVIVLADFSASMHFGTRVAFKSVVAARLAAILAWTAVKQGDRLGGFIFSNGAHREFTPRSREASILPFLAALSEYTQEEVKNNTNPEGFFTHALRRMRRVVRPGSTVVLISDFYHMEEASESHLSRLRAHNDVLMYHVCDPIELAAPKPQQYAMTDGHQEVVLDTSLASVSQAYQQYCEQRIERLSAQCRRLQMQYTQVTAEMDLSLLVRQTFPRRSNG